MPREMIEENKQLYFIQSLNLRFEDGLKAYKVPAARELDGFFMECDNKHTRQATTILAPAAANLGTIEPRRIGVCHLIGTLPRLEEIMKENIEQNAASTARHHVPQLITPPETLASSLDQLSAYLLDDDEAASEAADLDMARLNAIHAALQSDFMSNPAD